MKICTRCKIEKPLDEYNNYTKSSDGKAPRCRVCARLYYTNNKTNHLVNCMARNKRHRQAMALKAIDYLKCHPCVGCGEADIVVLDFDHIEPGNKLDDVARLIANGRKWKIIEDEIAKCQVLCANCHRRRTALQFGWKKLLVQLDPSYSTSSRVDKTKGMM